jgi:hypothetical protein
MNRDRFEELLAGHFDGSLSESEQREFEEFLTTYVEARATLASAARVHVDMTTELGTAVPAVPTSRPFRLPGLALAAALLIGFVALMFSGIFSSDPTNDSGEPHPAVAVEPIDKALRQNEQTTQTAVELLVGHAGGAMELDGGTLHFVGETVFAAPAEPVDDRRVIDLKAGHVRFEMDGGKVLVRTPAGDLTNIGTTFEVQLNPPMEEEVMITKVLSGKFRAFVTAVVLVGLVQFQGTQAAPLMLTPEMGKVALSDDASIGRVVDREGLAQIRQVGGDRWTVANEDVRLEPGDWIKTGKRGANAVVLRLSTGGQLTLGPGTLVEVKDPATIHVYRGELEVKASEDASITVTGPNDTSIAVENTKVLRARDEQLTALENTPKWLKGYQNDTVTEAMGSLLATVDGRDVKLTLGYHHVSVDIRDQIARTTIEESFVNHTSSILEGVFYFPLPQDASISSFAMWIGGELVQGDIVEKQRARAIYEQILREKRDPGLLEWTGGNIFKARVYPIGGEKRIRIQYTQVLPKVNGEYRYSYALQSEMMKLTPLKSLEMRVTVSSAEGIDSVDCPSHDCRIETTAHAARVEFEEEEYTPTADFELRIRTGAADQRVVLLPHRRADDGYFMMMVNAPDAENGDARNLLQNTDPLNVIIMADTSGSMSGTDRTNQIKFIDAFLASLGEKDTFNLMTADVHQRWAFDKPVANTGENREAAIAFVADRIPLGWSDLDRAFGAVLERIKGDTQVIYVGDGVITTGDADPTAFAHRLSQMKQGTANFHAVAPGTTYESVVMKAMAKMGKGTWREIGGGTDPAQTATELLKEITTPSVRDLEIRFNGIPVAAVYPEVLPALPAGTQQIIVGRYDATTPFTKGSVTVSGSFNGEAVTYRQDIDLGGAERGNSFIPRLWARHHLDFLLDQGGAGTQDAIIGLSEDFQIITPYTSFLVLESDADRERFNVEKRFRMRDGEEFFAKGQEDANYELKQKQMLIAKKWRQNIRRTILRGLEDMKRGLMEELLSLWQSGGYPELFSESASLGVGGGGGGSWSRNKEATKGGERRDNEMFSGESDGANAEPMADPNGPMPVEESEKMLDESEEAPGDMLAGKKNEEGIDTDGYLDLGDEDLDKAVDELIQLEERQQRQGNYAADKPFQPGPQREGRGASPRPGRTWMDRDSIGKRGGILPPQPPRDEFAARFPMIPEPVELPENPEWDKEILDILETLNRRSAISDKPLHFTVSSKSIDRRDRVTSAPTGELWVSKTMWTEITSHEAGRDFAWNWMDDKQRGSIRAAWMLGRTRETKDGDAISFSVPISQYFGGIAPQYSGWNPTLNPLDGNRLELKLTHPNLATHFTIYVIDTEKNAILEIRTERDGEVSFKRVFADFVQVNDAWWPQTITATNDKGRVTSTTKVTVESISTDALNTAIAASRDRSKNAIMLSENLSTLEDAKQAVKDGKATFEDRWPILMHYASTQQWDEADPQWDAIKALHNNKWGLHVLRLVYFSQSRRNEQTKDLLMETAGILAGTARDADYAAADDLTRFTGVLNNGNEQQDLLSTIKPVFERQKDIFEPLLSWEQKWLYSLDYMGRAEAAFAWQKMMAEKYPFRANLQTRYAVLLARHGELDAALAWLTDSEAKNGPWNDNEIQEHRTTGADLLWNNYRLDEHVSYIEGWHRDYPDLLSAEIWTRYLVALIMLDREEKAGRLATEWLTEYRKENLEKSEAFRLHAGIRYFIGQHRNYFQYSYYWRNRRVEENAAELLTDVARFYLENQQYNTYTQTIVTNSNYAATEAGIAFRVELHKKLTREIETMEPWLLTNLFSWLKGYSHFYATRLNTESLDAEWKKLLDVVYRRWDKEENVSLKGVLSSVILSHGDKDLRLRYYRRSFEIAKSEDAKARAAHDLFNALIGEKWSEEIQNELLNLIPHITSAPIVYWPRFGEDASEQIEGLKAEADFDAKLYAFYRFTNWLRSSRHTVHMDKIEKPNELTRRELKTEREKAEKRSWADAAGTLEALETTYTLEALRPWIKLERVYHQVKLKTKGDAPKTAALELLSAVLETNKEKDAKDILMHDRIMTIRCVATLAWISVLDSLQEVEEPHKALMALIDKALADKNELLTWEEAKYDLLVAMDLGDELEATLKGWFGDGDKFAKMRWGRDYAYILAERDDLRSAVKVLEQIEEADELNHRDYRLLADWYHALDMKDKVAEAKAKSWEVVNDYTIANWISGQTYKYERRGDGIPPALDPEIQTALTILMRKAPHPANHMYTIRRLYRATKDFRILQCLPEAVLGHTAQQIYPFLQNFTSIAGNIDDEATLDQLTDHLKSLHGKAESDVNRRALRLLEFMVQYRAADQAHGQGPHLEKALTALKDAFKGDWEDHEPVMMAEFLANHRRISQPTIQTEQVRQLKALFAMVKPGTLDRLRVGGHYSQILWRYQAWDDAIQVAETAILEYKREHDDLYTQESRNYLGTWVEWLVQRNRWRKAESIYKDELDGDYNQDMKHWFEHQLYGVYARALAHGGQVSLGSGQELYGALRDTLIQRLRVYTNESHMSNLAGTLANVFSTAHLQRFPTAGKDLSDFAYNVLPDVLGMYNYRNGQSVVGTFANTIESSLGKRAAVEFFVVRAETEPAWLALTGQDFWAHHAYRFTRWIVESGLNTGPLADRALAIILDELELDLRHMHARNRYGYWDNYNHFWRSKRGNFKEKALEILKDFPNSEQRILHICEYLYNGLDYYSDAIAILQDAQKKGVLTVNGLDRLANYLFAQRRYEEAVPIYRDLIRERPAQLNYRTTLMVCYFKTGKKDALRLTLDEAVAWLQDNNGWGEWQIAQLASTCLNTELLEPALEYYNEAVNLRTRSHSNRGVGDGTLANYYAALSQIYSRLDRTWEAVDAAAGAVISWGRNIGNQRHALNALVDALTNAKDLDGYVEKMLTEIEETGLENPILRQSLGKAYRKRKEYAKAAVHLRVAVEVQPNDIENHELLVKTYDDMKQPERAAIQLLDSARLSGHNFDLYVKLGDRWRKLDLSEDAERAYSMLAEMSAHESEGHRKWAAVLGKQARWSDAIVQWRQVIRCRTDEPTGYLGLAEALIQNKEYTEAKKTIDHLLKTEWPSHFENVYRDAEALRKELEQRQ